MEYFILTIYSIIIILNIYVQFNQIVIKKIPISFLFVFVYKLFAPKPLAIDIDIFYRDLLIDKTSTKLIRYVHYDNSKIKNTLWKFSNLKHLFIIDLINRIEKYHLNKVPDIKILKSSAYKRLEEDIKYINYNSNISKRQIIIFYSTTKGSNTVTTPILISHIKYTND